MGCSNMPNNEPFLCPTCGKDPVYTVWEGKYRPEIHQLSCGLCRKAVRGYSRQKVVDRWNKFVLSELFVSSCGKGENG